MSESEKEEEQIIKGWTKSFENMGYTVQDIKVWYNIGSVAIKINGRWYEYDLITGLQTEDYSDEEIEWSCNIL